MNQPIVAVVGAAGQTGALVVRQLARRGARARAVIRSDVRRPIVVEAGAAEVAVADLMEVDSMRTAFRGVDAVYISVPAVNRAETEMVANAVRAAEDAGVSKFVYHSVFRSNAREVRHHQRKAAAEELVRESSMRWAVMQPAMYAQSPLIPILHAANPRTEEGSIVVRTSFEPRSSFSLIDVEDIAEATATVILDERHDYGTYELAGPERQTIAEIYEQLALAWNRKIVVEVVDPVEFQRSMGRTPDMSQFADAVAMLDHYERHGFVGSPTVARCLLGRDPTSFADVARRLAPAWVLA